ncbi:hypothetical protein ACFY9N_00770 [Microbacterium sp. NPDC008134]|uniref:hypothetical protein n=1 Tax=Microbacterium sp. NPDC008134 TaxID=3364183 RepID=UPI0036EBF352
MIENTPPVPSHIQQRIALRRRRAIATAQLVFGSILVALWAALIAVGRGNIGSWFGLTAMALLALSGVLSLLKARRDTRAFEREHGADAGIQKPV